MSSAEALVGREGEVALGSAATRELFEGRASVLAIEGEAGIGKTRLVQGIVDDARGRGAAVFSGQAHPFERTRPFGLISAALGLNRRSPDPRRAALGALLAGEGAAPAPAGDMQYRIVEEIVDLVETACAERPVLLVAEDLHWADSASVIDIADRESPEARTEHLAKAMAAGAYGPGLEVLAGPFRATVIRRLP